MQLKWTHEDGLPGITYAEYKGHKLKIQPAGAFEWDGLIDGKIRTGYDDLEVIESDLMSMIDGTYKPSSSYSLIITEVKP